MYVTNQKAFQILHIVWPKQIYLTDDSIVKDGSEAVKYLTHQGYRDALEKSYIHSTHFTSMVKCEQQ